MSWLRSAVNKAVEVGGKNNITRTVRNYADSVVLTAGNAVSEGAKLIQDRIVRYLLSRLLIKIAILIADVCVKNVGIEECEEL